MSHKVVSLVYSRVLGSSVRKGVLAYLADRASDDGRGVWCSKQTIADETELGRSTIIRTCNEFVAEGILIAVGERKCANGATVEYDLNLEAIAALPVLGSKAKASHSGTSPDMDPSHSGTPPVPQRDPTRPAAGPHPSRSGTPPVPQRDPNHPLTILEPSLNLIGGDNAPDPPKRRRAIAIPENWVPSDANIQHALSKKLSPEEIDNEADQFRNHHLARGTTFKDWDAAWRTWVGNAIKFGRVNMACSPAPSRYGQGGGIAGAVARRRAGGSI